MAASPSPGTSPAASTAPRTVEGGPGRLHGPGAFRGPGLFGGPGFADGRGFKGPGFGPITITAIDGSNLSLKTDDGWTRTITVGSTTSLLKAGQKISLGDLSVGDTIRFRETRASDGSYSIDEIDVVLPQVAGTVTAVTGDGFTLNSRDGTSWAIAVNGSTSYRLGSKGTGAKSDVKVGSEVFVEGTRGTGNSLTAAAVHILLPHIAGQVTARTGSTLTIRQFDGTMAKVRVSSGTTFRVQGVSDPNVSDITVGMTIVVEGTRNADGSVDASTVLAGRGFGRFNAGLFPPLPGASPAPTTSPGQG